MSTAMGSARARLVSLALLLASGSTAAQDLIVSSLAVPVYAETTAPGPYYPGPNVPRFSVIEAMPIAPAMVPFMGDLTMDNATGVIYHSNGTTVTATNHPAYAALAPAFGPTAFPIGPVTGIAIDSAAGILWCTDGTVCYGVAPLPGLPLLVLPFPVVGPVPVVAPPLFGLDWDPITASLWAIDAIGNVYNFLPSPFGAVPVGPQPTFPFMPMLPPPPVDLVLHRNPRGIVGIHVQGVGMSMNILSGVLTPTVAFIPPGSEDGIAFHAYPDTLPVPTCMFCPGLPPATAGTTGPMSIGNTTFAFTLSGLPAGAACLFGADLVALLPPATIPSGCQLYLSPTSPSLLVLAAAANPLGVASIPVNLAAFPPASLGLTAFIQWAYVCPISGALLLSESQQFMLCAP
jgi:hypothetical protein